MSQETVKIPDLGGADSVDVIEICVKVGDRIEPEQPLVVLESDKASMEVPSPVAGTVQSIALKVGDKVSQGSVVLVLTTDAAAPVAEPVSAAAPVAAPAAAPKAEAPQATEPVAAAPVATASQKQTVRVPDLGGAEGVVVIEVSIQPGDSVAKDSTLIVLESDKASMEVPSPVAGTVLSVAVKVGDKLNQGDVIAELDSPQAASATSALVEKAVAPVATSAAPVSSAPAPASPVPAAPVTATPTLGENRPSSEVYAGPAVRMLARELGVDLAQISGSGPRGRIQKDDLQAWVKQRLAQAASGAAGVAAGSGIPAIPSVDFSRFGEVRDEPMSRLHQLTAQNMLRSWLNVPHVTQFDDADITDLEDFRDGLKAEAQKRGSKLTPVPFLLKAVALALRAHPKLNASLAGDQIVYKDYVHVGFAVDTPAGLVVPVLRDVDTKSVWTLAEELADLAERAKARKLKPEDMQGGCFTVSSLGAIGGQGFTPIVNAPEVAILGVSRLAVKPVWDGKQFQPRKMLPLSLSYDHRAINGADAGRFLTELTQLLADIRRFVL